MPHMTRILSHFSYFHVVICHDNLLMARLNVNETINFALNVKAQLKSHKEHCSGQSDESNTFLILSINWKWKIEKTNNTVCKLIKRKSHLIFHQIKYNIVEKICWWPAVDWYGPAVTITFIVLKWILNNLQLNQRPIRDRSV